jgi:hypothetical protein
LAMVDAIACRRPEPAKAPPDSSAAAPHDSAADRGAGTAQRETQGAADARRLEDARRQAMEIAAAALASEAKTRAAAEAPPVRVKNRGMGDTPDRPPPAKEAPEPRRRSVEEQVSSLSPADLSVRGIDSLQTNVARQVVVRMTKPTTKADSEALANLPAMKGGAYHAKASVGDSARVCLHGADAGDFSIHSSFGECSTQPVTLGDPPEWTWLVTPLKSGNRTLIVSVEALLVGAPSKKFQQFFPVTVSVGSEGATPSSPSPLMIALVVLAIVGAITAIVVLRARSRPSPVQSAVAPVRAGAKPFDAFISHSTRDAEAAAAICGGLERAKLRCWIAPRDIEPGASYDESIIAALDKSRSMVLVLSEASNASEEVKKEVRNAVTARIPVLPFRIDPVEMSPALRYHLSAAQWIDASRRPRPQEIDLLAAAIRRDIDGGAGPAGG